MNGFQEIFKRIEIKYLMDGAQYRALRDRLQSYVHEDEYGLTQVLNIYLDTPDYFLIRQSLEKPRYKEKLRLRSYGVPTDNALAFIEIKKKYAGVVYKRRVGVPYQTALQYVRRVKKLPDEVLQGAEERQIAGELDYFMDRYQGLAPRVAISYERVALVGNEDPELRITFDKNLRYRKDALDLRQGATGKELLASDQYLMELKIAGAIPMEIARALSELQIWQTSYSKYGKAYEELFLEEMKRRQKITDLQQYKERQRTVKAI